VRYSIGQYGDWTAPAWLTSRYYGEVDYVSAAASAAGDVYAVWIDEVGRYNQIFGRLYTPGSFGGQAEPIATPRSGVELFPNPAKAGRVTVQYTLPSPCPLPVGEGSGVRGQGLTVTLLDVSGRAVRRSALAAEAPVGRRGVRSSGKGSFSIDASGLNAGVYILKLESGTSSQTRKLVIQ
jgi:hypothetical protein